MCACNTEDARRLIIFSRWRHVCYVLLIQKMLDSVPVQHLPDICALLVKASYAEKVQVLDAVDISERFKKTLPLLMRQIEVC